MRITIDVPDDYPTLTDSQLKETINAITTFNGSGSWKSQQNREYQLNLDGGLSTVDDKRTSAAHQTNGKTERENHHESGFVSNVHSTYLNKVTKLHSTTIPTVDANAPKLGLSIVDKHQPSSMPTETNKQSTNPKRQNFRQLRRKYKTYVDPKYIKTILSSKGAITIPPEKFNSLPQHMKSTTARSATGMTFLH
jgi:predicted RNA-binding protein with RPS1 domain